MQNKKINNITHDVTHDDVTHDDDVTPVTPVIRLNKIKGRPYKKPTKLIIICESDNLFAHYEHE